MISVLARAAFPLLGTLFGGLFFIICLVIMVEVVIAKFFK